LSNIQNLKHQPTAPIGVFDSGIGGLTVAHAIKALMPHENMIYFGDTAHLPYGDKSEAAIQAYSIKIANILLQKGCKVIVIACNSASSAAYELLKEYVRKEAYVINVIDPMVDFITKQFGGKTIGLIGTKRTVQSAIYLRKISEKKSGVILKTLATPLLAPMIEEGFFNNQISKDIIAQYLSDSNLSGLDALVLACTHYPLIRKEIEEYYAGKVAILDSSDVVSSFIKYQLAELGLLNTESNSTSRFYVSDYTDAFEASTRLFFGQNVHLECMRLWD